MAGRVVAASPAVSPSDMLGSLLSLVASEGPSTDTEAVVSGVAGDVVMMTDGSLFDRA